MATKTTIDCNTLRCPNKVEVIVTSMASAGATAAGEWSALSSWLALPDD